MIAVKSFVPEAGAEMPPQDIGALPDAPLAMPKQRLEADRPSALRLMGGLVRPLFARTGRSRG
jgi:hypothetical protein